MADNVDGMEKHFKNLKLFCRLCRGRLKDKPR